MAASDDEELIRRYFDELVNRRDLKALERLCSRTFFDHNPPAGATEGGVSATREGFQRLFRGLPDVQGEVHEILAAGDQVFARTTCTGTHRGDLMGLRPSGRRLTMEVWHLFRVQDGVINEHRAQSDTLMLLRQLAASARQPANVILVQPPELPASELN